MAKTKTIYTCTECGGQSPKWQGQCPACNAWNTLVETIAESAKPRYQALAASSQVQMLGEVEGAEASRIPTTLGELDRVLGGGLVAGGVVLIGGDPGIGKSTLLLQALAVLSQSLPTLYVSGEESAQQLALRARRLQLPEAHLPVLPEIRLEAILSHLASIKPAIAVIDSIQTVYSETLTSAPGSVAQVRECAAQLTRYAKQSGCAILLVGHVTKEGAIAGPRVLEHIVDTVLYFEGDTGSSFRLVRAIKNRFGAVNEIGVFAMTEKGLKGVSNPSAIFLSHHGTPVPGSCVLVTQEGTRPLLVEIQALVDSSQSPNPRRLSVGLEQNRLAMLLAVLHRHAGIACSDQDVFVNAVGGVKISEPAADLAVLAAIVSSLRSQPLPDKLVMFGEVGLAGEIRPVQRGQERLKEAAKLGFTQAIVPAANQPKQKIAGMTIHPV
ncbi:MAG: DNA repair protein RadA, partial [Gammaproteobacteria bacterium]|nr:DNA repair protein RadA [Gammaproteobacteria bacterium]